MALSTALFGNASLRSDVHIARFEQKPNIELKADELTQAYGDWAIPELVKKLQDHETSTVLEAKVLKALSELCLQSERVGEAVRAGIVPVILGSDAIGRNAAEPGREALVLDLIGCLSCYPAGRNALLAGRDPSSIPGGALDELKPLATQRRSLAKLAPIVLNLCMLREGADKALDAGYLDMLVPALTDEFETGDAILWLKVIAKMLRESSTALEASVQVGFGTEVATFLMKWKDTCRGANSIIDPKKEERLNAALLVCHALTVDDEHKKAFVSAGVVEQTIVLMVLGTPGGALSEELSWETKSNLLTLVAQLAVIVPGKQACIDCSYGLVPLANALKGADSVMLQGAAIQAMLHVVEHPKAREYFLELGIEEDVSEIMNNAKDPFLLRVIKSFLELLNWKP
jgi:hypothetical protein